jgi:hypothetical protein
MDIKDTKIEVASLPFNERGEKLEPEEQPAKLTQSGSAPVALAGTLTGSMPISIEQHLSAGALAATVRDPCGTCKHFDRTAWHKHVRFLGSSYNGKQMLNNIMAELIATQNVSVQDLHRSPIDNDFDTQHAVNSMGVCRVLSEVHNDLVAVHPLGVCPPEMRSAPMPRGFYVPVDKDTERAGSAAFDKIMEMARKNEGV